MYRQAQILFIVTAVVYCIYLLSRPNVTQQPPSKPIFWSDTKSDESDPNKPNNFRIYTPPVKSKNDSLEEFKQRVIEHNKRHNLPNPYTYQPQINTQATKPTFRMQGCKPMHIEVDSATQAMLDSARIIGPDFLKNRKK